MWPGPVHEPIVNGHLSWGWITLAIVASVDCIGLVILVASFEGQFRLILKMASGFQERVVVREPGAVTQLLRAPAR